MFNFDLHKIVLLNLPITLRSEKISKWFDALLSQIANLIEVFIQYRRETLFMLAHNSQIIYLEHILNYKFNPDKNLHDTDYVNNGIYIEDGIGNTDTFIYNTKENATDTFLHNGSEAPFSEVYLFNNEEMIPITGFIINIPDSFVINENELKSLVNSLKLAGKKYSLKYYTISENIN